MPRTVRDSTLDTRSARARLKTSGKPYYRAIDAGLHLGYRKGKTGGKWVARWYVGDEVYRLETIGSADDVIDADGAQILNFAQAQAAARQLYVTRKREAAGLSTKVGPYTVKDCVEDYLTWMEANRKSADDTRYRVESMIIPELGETACSKLTATAIQKWLQKVAAAPARLRTKKGKKQKYRSAAKSDDEVRRRRATTNRTFTVLRAALNRAWKDGQIGSDDAWRRVKPFPAADASRVRYLSIKEAKRLINASSANFRHLIQAALATGARYGELAALSVEDFNIDSGTVHVRASKSGKGRHIVLTDEGIALFSGLTAGRAQSEPILRKADGSRWDTAHQSRPMTEACKNAKISPSASFHVTRHTYASHAIMNGAPLMVVAKNLGHVDTRMVEKHYGHLAPSYVAEAIRAAAPRFGIKAPAKVAVL